MFPNNLIIISALLYRFQLNMCELRNKTVDNTPALTQF